MTEITATLLNITMALLCVAIAGACYMIRLALKAFYDWRITMERDRIAAQIRDAIPDDRLEKL